MRYTNPNIILVVAVGAILAACDAGYGATTDEEGTALSTTVELVPEPMCVSNEECPSNGCCGFAEGWEEPTCVEAPSPHCDVPGLIPRISNGSSTVKDTCYCSSGTYRVKWCYSSAGRYWYTNGFC